MVRTRDGFGLKFGGCRSSDERNLSAPFSRKKAVDLELHLSTVGDRFGVKYRGMADGDWELCNDDGFVYKRRKKQHLESSTVAADASNPELEAKQRREQRKKTLLRLKEQYGREIKQWERLSAALQQLESNNQADGSLLPQTTFIKQYTPQQIQEGEVGCQQLITDELLQQAEAQEAILQDLLNLCDVAESSCKAQEDSFKQSLIDLPVWASPQTLMASLSEGEDSDNVVATPVIPECPPLAPG